MWLAPTSRYSNTSSSVVTPPPAIISILRPFHPSLTISINFLVYGLRSLPDNPPLYTGKVLLKCNVVNPACIT